ncbi:MAG TPA: DedA family protein [Longimicrobiales bacterium]|nr:DedA family protein [Longimicrobiales bacterium]
MDGILAFLGSLPETLVYIVLGAGAALENVVPVVPADTVILLGGFVAGAGAADPWSVFLVTWASNVGSALVVYWAGHRYGRSFFAVGPGRRLLSRGQMERMEAFYRRWGLPAIFFTRFLPGLRAVVPAFAGVSHHPFLPVAVPVAVASAIWYGGLVWLGATAGRNLDTIRGWMAGTNRVLLVLSLAVAVALAAWWWRTRRASRADTSSPGPLGDGPERDGP